MGIAGNRWTLASLSAPQVQQVNNEMLNIYIYIFFLLNVLSANESMLDTDVVNCASFWVRVLSIFTQHTLIKDVDQCAVYIAA